MDQRWDANDHGIRALFLGGSLEHGVIICEHFTALPLVTISTLAQIVHPFLRTRGVALRRKEPQKKLHSTLTEKQLEDNKVTHLRSRAMIARPEPAPGSDL